MAEDIQYIKKQIEKEMNHLKHLYNKINRIERKKESRKDRIKKLEKELMRKNPDIEIDRELLALVGTESQNTPSQDKEIVRRIVAERYG
jgi:signal recognition particle GTPase